MHGLNMTTFLFFGILSIPVIVLSWRTLFQVNSHGFYRFFSWECIIWLFVSNYPYWFDNPFSSKQWISWILLFISVYLVISGTLLMKKKGKPGKSRNEKPLYAFENTTELIDGGIFRYIRHPLYSSLLFLIWGIFFKHTTTLLFCVSVVSTVFLFLMAIADEKECIRFFGDAYKVYMKRTKRFIPFIL